jgi:hypothetical protein
MAFVKRFLKKSYSALGWKTNRKLVCIASDDWGGVRVRSLADRNDLQNAGFSMHDNRFNKYDTLESNEDIESLYEVLLKHRDSRGNHPIITAFVNVTNPDFDSILKLDFKEYKYETFDKTLEKYPHHDKVFELYHEGIKNNIFVPQFHGREHLNVNFWIKDLQSKNIKLRTAFDHNFFMMDSKDLDMVDGNEYGAPYDFKFETEIKNHIEIIEDGLNIFKNLFGYNATVFTPPSQVYNYKVEPTLLDNGISMIDVPMIHNPQYGGTILNKLNYIGKRNKNNQLYVVRNAVFEPNMNSHSNGVYECLNGIGLAFQSNKPAIISNHRAAFVGGIESLNRKKSLKSLDELLTEIIKRWPDVEFVSASELNTLMLERINE